ncbi:CASP-like protein UU-1 [Phragmites australis]|uniref:CASP-like protein UU-1 n=1 Tax=Phragmites australis TaxID=29695 RepID=UPI002D76DE15|nr:CASP-like protein UU-1 [Phragmites australis]
MTTRMTELESQEAVETIRAASAAHVRTSAALRLLAFAASLAAAVIVVTNREARWGVSVSFKMFDVWEYLMMNLQTAATAGAGAMGSVAMWGNKPSRWFAVCRLYRLYCNKGAVSLALAFVAFAALGVAGTLSRYPRAPPPAAAR